MRKNARFYHYPSFLLFFTAEFFLLIFLKLAKRNVNAVKGAFSGLLAGIRFRKSDVGKFPRDVAHFLGK